LGERKPVVTVALVSFVMTCFSWLFLPCDTGRPEGLHALTNPKAIVIDCWPSIAQMSIPKVLDYPVWSLYEVGK